MREAIRIFALVSTNEQFVLCVIPQPTQAEFFLMQVRIYKRVNITHLSISDMPLDVDRSRIVVTRTVVNPVLQTSADYH